LSLSPPLAWLKEVIDTVEGQCHPTGTIGPFDGCYWVKGLPYHPYENASKWPPQFPRRQALEAYRDWAKEVKPFGASEYTASPPRFWSEICKVIPRGQTNRQTTGGVRNVAIDLTDLQKNFEKYLRGEVV
jgi:hypothetical protein